MLDEKRLKKKIADKEAYLNMLEELDRTGQLRKSNYKEKVTFTIDEQLMIDFRKYCEENQIKMSTKVESLIKKYLKNKV